MTNVSGTKGLFRRDSRDASPPQNPGSQLGDALSRPAAPVRPTRSGLLPLHDAEDAENAVPPPPEEPILSRVEVLERQLEADIRSGTFDADEERLRHRLFEVIAVCSGQFIASSCDVDMALVLLTKGVELYERWGDDRKSALMAKICLHAFCLHASRATGCEFMPRRAPSGGWVLELTHSRSGHLCTDPVDVVRASMMLGLAQDWCPDRVMMSSADSGVFTSRCLPLSSIGPESMTQAEVARLVKHGSWPVNTWPMYALRDRIIARQRLGEIATQAPSALSAGIISGYLDETTPDVPTPVEERYRYATQMQELLSAEFKSLPQRRKHEVDVDGRFEARTETAVQAVHELWRVFDDPHMRLAYLSLKATKEKDAAVLDAIRERNGAAVAAMLHQAELDLLRRGLDMHERAFGGLLVAADHPVRTLAKRACRMYRSEAEAEAQAQAGTRTDPMAYLRYRYLREWLVRQNAYGGGDVDPPGAHAIGAVDLEALSPGQLRWLQTDEARECPFLRGVADLHRQKVWQRELAKATPGSLAGIAAGYVDENAPAVPIPVQERDRYATGMQALLNREFPSPPQPGAEGFALTVQRFRTRAQTTLNALHDLWRVFDDPQMELAYLLLKARGENDEAAMAVIQAGDKAAIRDMSRRRELALLHTWLDVHAGAFGDAGEASANPVYPMIERTFKLHLERAARDATEYLRAGLLLQLLPRQRNADAMVNAWLDAAPAPLGAHHPIDIASLTPAEVRRLQGDGARGWFDPEFLGAAKRAAATPATIQALG